MDSNEARIAEELTPLRVLLKLKEQAAFDVFTVEGSTGTFQFLYASKKLNSCLKVWLADDGAYKCLNIGGQMLLSRGCDLVQAEEALLRKARLENDVALFLVRLDDGRVMVCSEVSFPATTATDSQLELWLREGIDKVASALEAVFNSHLIWGEDA
ncbi:MAG: hypothetical protein Q4P06_05805 [Actinomycetaceae bacterium]|nr:hypothetical protein [Actinomycetaceae bacterium]